MTIEQCLKELRGVRKGGVSRRQLYRYLELLRIRPLGIRQRPQQWPTSTPARVKELLGLSDEVELTGSGRAR